MEWQHPFFCNCDSFLLSRYYPVITVLTESPIARIKNPQLATPILSIVNFKINHKHPSDFSVVVPNNIAVQCKYSQYIHLFVYVCIRALYFDFKLIYIFHR